MTVPARVEVRIDTLVVPIGIADEPTVREAVHAALEAEVTRRLTVGAPAPAARPKVTVALRDRVPSDASGLGALVATETVRAVLP